MTTTLPTNPTPAELKAFLRTAMTERLAKVRALPTQGFVRMTPYGAAYAEGSPTLTGLENATITPMRDLAATPIRNGAYELVDWMPIEKAKAIAIPALEKALASLDEILPSDREAA